MRGKMQNQEMLHNFDALPPQAFVKRPVVQALFGGISDEEVRRCVKEGRLPKPKKLGSRNLIWQVGELREALAKLQTKVVFSGSSSSHPLYEREV